MRAIYRFGRSWVGHLHPPSSKCALCHAFASKYLPSNPTESDMVHIHHIKGDPVDPIELGHNIRRRRKALRISQQDLADLVDVNRRLISELERGVGGTAIRTVTAVCQALGLELRLEPKGHRAP